MKKFLLIAALAVVAPIIAISYYAGETIIDAFKLWVGYGSLIGTIVMIIAFHEGEPSPSPLDDLSELEDYD